MTTQKREATPPLWQGLKQLVELDQKQEAVQSQITKIEQEIAQDNRMLPELQTTIDTLKRAVIEAKKNVDLQELNAQDLKEQETVKRKALDKAKNQKELEAVEKELSAILQQASEQDDALVKTWHSLDIARKKEEAEVGALQEKIDMLQKDAEEKKGSIVKLEEESKVIQVEKEKHEATIPAEWLTKYQRMRNKVQDPIVPVINKSCSACYYSVPPQDMMRLKNRALLYCRSCYRLLYHDQEEENDLQKTSF